ncbi:hypothetical protein Hanom_Chr16g01424881 [Helianthus anomalus]
MVRGYQEERIWELQRFVRWFLCCLCRLTRRMCSAVVAVGLRGGGGGVICVFAGVDCRTYLGGVPD